MLTPTLKKVVENHKDQINLLLVDVDEFGDIAQEFDVSAIPCVTLVKEGEGLAGFLGPRPQETIERFTSAALVKA